MDSLLPLMETPMETAKKFALILMIQSALLIRQNATGTEADMLPNFAVSRALLASALALAVSILFQASTAAAESPTPTPPLLTIPLSTLPLSSISPSQSDPSGLLRESPIGEGATELSWLTGVGVGINGGATENNFWAMQLRLGRVLRTASGSGFFRGHLEYAIEFLPAFLTAQSTALFGGGITPLLLQYNFAGGGRFVPFVQTGVGWLFTTRKVPEGTSHFNLTPQGGVGVYWFHRPSTAVVFGVRYHHISNASTAERNPGHNALYIHTGISWWR